MVLGSMARRYIYNKEFLEYPSNVLCFRMLVIKRATDYKNYLGLSINDCHLFDT